MMGLYIMFMYVCMIPRLNAQMDMVAENGLFCGSDV